MTLFMLRVLEIVGAITITIIILTLTGQTNSATTESKLKIHVALR